MANISLTNNTIYAQNINNFTGELFKVGGQRTPLLSAVGGLNGGKVLNSTFWQVQVEDNATISFRAYKGTRRFIHLQNILEEIELHILM